jgi:membrane-associated phospholipid phosphatase
VRFRYVTLCEQGVLLVSLLAVGLLLLDPFMLERARTLSPHARAFFGAITDVGRSNWILIPTAAVIAFAIVLRRNHLGLRNSAGYGLSLSTAGYVFVSVAGAGLVADLLKNVLGRARPKLYDVVGHFDFHFFAFDPAHASIPSGQAINIFAFATVIAILWPRGRLLLYTLAAWIAASRVFVGAHYFTDALLGAVLGVAFPYFVRDRFAARRWLFEYAPDGGYRLRGPRTQAWLGWPEPVRKSQDRTASRKGSRRQPSLAERLRRA